jgi:lipopolysaccharide export system permease protein
MTRRFSLYLVREILPLYAAGLTALLILLLGAFLLLEGVLADAVARGVGPALVARFLLYSIPSAAAMGLPLALLFAALLGITRLSQDSEIKAGLLLGLSPQQFLTPILLLGFLVSTVSFINNELLAPWSYQRAQEALKDILVQSPETLIEEGSFFTDALGRSVYLSSIAPGGVVRGVTVIQPGGTTGPSEVIRAESGVLDEAAGVWRLSGIRMLRYRDGRVVLDAPADEALLPVRGLSASSSTPPELTRLPLRELFARLRGTNPQDAPAEWTALHRKFAEPSAAFAFALFALSIGLYSFRRNFGLGLVSVLFLTFVYYATWSVSNLLGAQGTIPAVVAGWLPFALYLVAGLVLLVLSWRR